MYFSAFITALLGVSSVTAVENPHKRVPKRPVIELRENVKRETNPIQKRAEFLTAKTKSQFTLDHWYTTATYELV